MPPCGSNDRTALTFMSKENRPADFAATSSHSIKGWLGAFLWGDGRQPAEAGQTSFQTATRELSGVRFRLLFGLLLAAYAAIASCSIHAPFFPLDDMDELFLVRTSHSWVSLLGTDLYHFFRPVKNLMFALYNWLDHHGGMAAVRTIPLFIGWLSAFAVFGLCRRVLAGRGWALAATAIWLLSPTLVDCGAWLSASNILLMTGLAAAALTCHDLACEAEDATIKRAGITGGIWNVLALLCFALALFTYEGAVSVVALFFVMDWYLHPARLRRPSTWHRYFLYGLTLAIYLILRHYVQSTQHVLGGFSNVSRLQAAVSSGYFTMLHAGVWFWPFNRMAVIGGYYWGQISWMELSTCAIVVLAAIVFSIRWRWRFPRLALGILWFLLAFAPMSNVLGFRNGPYCDSYIALASVGIAIALVAILRGLRPSTMTGFTRTIAVTVITLLIGSRVAAVFEAASWSYAWNDPMVAYQRSLRTFPKAFDVMTELAKLHAARQEYHEADELAAASIQLGPDRSDPYAIRAVVAEQDGRIQDALKWLDLYRKYTHSDAWWLTFEADIYANQLQQPDRAEALYREAIAKQPWSQDSLRAAYELAYMLAQQGHQKEAVSLWEKLLAYHPNDQVLHWDLSIAYAKLGDQKRASYHRDLAGDLAHQSSPRSANDKKLP